VRDVVMRMPRTIGMMALALLAASPAPAAPTAAVRGTITIADRGGKAIDVVFRH